jgi:hypothetical protein
MDNIFISYNHCKPFLSLCSKEHFGFDASIRRPSDLLSSIVIYIVIMVLHICIASAVIYITGDWSSHTTLSLR